jgi:hypothetical protein
MKIIKTISNIVGKVNDKIYDIADKKIMARPKLSDLDDGKKTAMARSAVTTVRNKIANTIKSVISKSNEVKDNIEDKTETSKSGIASKLLSKGMGAVSSTVLGPIKAPVKILGKVAKVATAPAKLITKGISKVMGGKKKRDIYDDDDIFS